ncbi:MAG: isopeptide-forming domain-containing fimbrial protein, partial [Myxococcota bacterium]
MRATTTIIAALALVGFGQAASAQVPINAFDTPVTESFDGLADTGTSDVLPAGWHIFETGTSSTTVDQKYAAGDGTSNAGNTYSAGTTGSTERALGILQSGSNLPTIGAELANATGGSIQALAIQYTGELWRLGTADRVDRIDFQYSLDATSLSTGTWIDVDALDHDNSQCTTPPSGGPCADDAPTGPKDGNLTLNRQTHSATISGLDIAPGASVWIRWTDFNANGSDDLLAVDDFSVTAQGLVADQAFALRRSLTVAGGYAVVGNVILDCSTNPCPAGNNGTPFTYVDADQDDTTQGSSAATLSLPAGARPQAAYLLVTVNGSLETGTSPRWADALTTADVSAKLRGPSDSTYAPLVPDHVSIDDTGLAYQGLYDVTKVVQAQGAGQYWLADPTIYPVDEAFNAVGNWILIVVYEQDGAPLRLVNIYDGVQGCFRSSFDISLGGFVTPSLGQVTGLLTIAAGDGSSSAAGVDSVTLNALGVQNALNPVSNIANNTVSGVDGLPFPRVPDTFNVTDELVDIDTFDIAGAFENGATTGNVHFSCTDDGVVWHGLVLAFDINAPSVTLTKSVSPTAPGPIQAGSVVDYSITATTDATSVENAKLVTVTDALPLGVTASGTSISVDDGSAVTTLTTAADGDAGEIVNGVVTVRLGDLAIGQHRTITFEATVDAGASGTIANTASVSYRGVSSTAPILGASAPATFDVVDCGLSGCVSQALVVVFFDDDGDGLPGNNDVGLANWIIDIGLDENVTDAQGAAFFDSADQGTQPFGVTPPAGGEATWIFDAPPTVDISDNSTANIFFVPVGCSCDDGDPCTFDSCFAGECSHEVVINEGVIDDTCDGVDDDCNGATDDAWVSMTDL